MPGLNCIQMIDSIKTWTIAMLNRKELEMQRSELLWSLSGTHALFVFRLASQQLFNTITVLISKNLHQTG